MTGFQSKAISFSRTLGDRLRAHRERSGISLEAASQATAVSVKYLQAIEESSYRTLPGDVYARNFLRAYAEFLRLSADDVLAQYDTERGVVKTMIHQQPRFVQRHVDAKPIFTPRRIRWLAFVAAAVAVFGYLVWQVWSIIRPPQLIITGPPAQLTTTERSVRVEGSTERESEVTINGQGVLVDADGSFSELVDLHSGLNVIKIVSVRKRSRPRTEYRQVLVQELTDASR